MPNHYTNIAICAGIDWERMGEEYEFDVDDFNERHAETDFCGVVMPMPEPIEQVPSVSYPDGTTEKQRLGADQDWYEWANENWGTKWGTYRAKAFQMGGDSRPVAITFETAWGPPKILTQIGDWIKKTYGFRDVAWVGVNPYDDSVEFSTNV